MIDRVLVAGGGTGGQLFPGIAVVEEIRRRLPRIEVLFVGTEHGIEAGVLPRLGERFQPIDAEPLVGRGVADFGRGLLGLPHSALRAWSIVRSFRPDVALGLGGHAAGPLLVAAAAQRVPTALLEQSANSGLAKRLLGKSVGRAYFAQAQTAELFDAARACVVGNPVRRAFVDASRMAGHDPAGVEARSRSILVLGGLQGAPALNQIVPAALATAGVSQRGIAVVHQTGPGMVEQVEQAYADCGLRAEVVPFIDDVAKAYVRASVVIARPGATSLAELCAIGRPAVLVPHPDAARDHQTCNALALQDAGAALCIAEHALSVETLGATVHALLSDRARRHAMAEAARRCGRPDAAAMIVDDLFAWLRVSSETGAAASNTGSHGDVVESAGPSGALPRRPIQRKPKLKRAELRVRPVEISIDAVT